MTIRSWVNLPARPVLICCALAICTLSNGSLASAQFSDESSPSIEELQQQVTEQEHAIRTLRERLDELDGIYGLQPVHSSATCTHEYVQRVPLVAELPACGQSDTHEVGKPFHELTYFVDYDRGWLIRSVDRERFPLEVKLNGWIQFRHHGFVRRSESWTDNAGITRPILNRNAFDIERARLTLSGNAIDPRLSYFLQLDGDTDESHAVDFFDYWWAWRLTDRFQVQMGKRKVSASQQWLLGARRTRFIDRPLANDFFRPDRTVGIFGLGQFAQHGHYEVMVGNGYRTTNLPNALTDDRFTFAATSYIDPAGEFGEQFVDFEATSRPLWRIGQSVVYSPQAAIESTVALEEADFLRLADGTRLTQVGALAPGVTVSEFDIWLYGVDLLWKYRGWSLTSEGFLRWIDGIQADGLLPTRDIFQRGFYVEGGRFLVAQTLDLNLRYSRVDGDFGETNEFAAGFNWYPLAKSTLKFAFDITQLDGSSLQHTTSDILVGDDGLLFRTQFQAEF